MPNVGSIDVEAEIHGDKWPAQLKKIMEQAGRQMDKAAKEHGKRYSEGFSSQLGKSFARDGNKVVAQWADKVSDKMRQYGGIAGRTYGDALREDFSKRIDEAVDDLRRLHSPDGFAQLVSEVGDVDEAFRRMQNSMKLARENGRVTIEEISRLREAFREQRAAVDESVAAHSREVEAQKQVIAQSNRHLASMARRIAINSDLADSEIRVGRESVKALGDSRAAVERHLGPLKRLSLGWQGMSHNARQWTLIIGAIMAAMASAAALGSALGGTIVALGAATAALGAGAGIAVAGFKGLYDESIKLSPAAQAAKDALKGVGDTLKELQGGITNSMFANMAPSIRAFGDQIVALSPLIQSFAGTVGDALGRVFDALASPVALKNFQGLLAGFGSIFDSITDAAIGFGSGLGGVLVASLPTAQKFAQAIEDVGRSFGTWANSDEGRERLRQWFETAERLMPQVMALVGDLGNMLADLVTPATIAATEVLIQALRDFVPVLGEILHTLGEINIFGIIATALNALGPVISAVLGAIAPVIATALPAVQELALAIGGALVEAVNFLAPIIAGLAPVIATIVSGFAGFVSILTPFVPLIASVAGAAGLFLGSLKVLGPIISGVSTAINVAKGAMTALNLAMSANPIGLVITAITALVAGLTWFFTQTEVGRQMWAAFTQFLTEAWNNVVTFITEAFTNVGNFITSTSDAIAKGWNDFWTGVADFASDIWNNISTWISDAITNIQTVITTVTDAISTAWNVVWTAISKVAQTIWNGIVSFVTTYINTVRTIITTVVTAISTFWSNIWNTIKTVASTVWNAIVSFVTDYINNVRTVITAVVTAISSWWSTNWDKIRLAAVLVWNLIKTAVQTAINNVRSVITSVVSAISSWWSSSWNSIKSVASSVWNGIKSVIKGAIDGVKSVINNVLNTIKRIWSNIWNGLKSTAQNVWNAIKGAIQGPIDAIKGFINSLSGPINAAIGWFQSLFGAAQNAQGAASAAANSGSGGRVPQMASGGLLTHARHVIAGEAGPEAIVPLDRPLNRVDPSVRWLSAIAQGHTPRMASGGVVGGGSTTVFEDGAIRVVGALDPRRAAIEVADEIVRSL